MNIIVFPRLIVLSLIVSVTKYYIVDQTTQQVIVF